MRGTILHFLLLKEILLATPNSCRISALNNIITAQNTLDKKADMKTEEITIRVDSETAQTYRSADEQQKSRLNVLFNLYLAQAESDTDSLEDIIKQTSKEAEQNGMTPEILAELLDTPINLIS